jgi:hypothetical protein
MQSVSTVSYSIIDIPLVQLHVMVTETATIIYVYKSIYFK